MNKRGMEMGGVGTLVIIAVAIIVAVTLLTGGITSNVATLTTKVNYVNLTYTAPSAANTAIELQGQAWRNVIVTNATSGTLIPTNNYTITNYQVSSTGSLVTKLTTTTGGQSLGYYGKGINISGEVEPYGYDTTAGGRAIADLIIVFAALAIAIVVLVPVIRNGFLDLFD